MGKGNEADFLLYSLSELRPGEAKRRFRKSIFEDYPKKGFLGQCVCAYCGEWNEKLTIDHIIPKSKGGPHFAKWNNAPACLSCNAAKGSLPVFEWWRPQKFWTMEREQALLSWVHSNSFVSAHSAIGSWEEWMEQQQRVLPVHEHPSLAIAWPPSLACLNKGGYSAF
jgi:hypothetical protein